MTTKRQFMSVRRFGDDVAADEHMESEDGNKPLSSIPGLCMLPTWRPPVPQAVSTISPGAYQEVQLRAGQAPAPPLYIKTGKAHKRKKRVFPIWARVVTGIMLLLLLLAGSAAWYYYANLAAPLSHITGQAVRRFEDDVPSVPKSATATSAPLSGRMNILLLGSDTDSKFALPLAQTDIVLTIDPQARYVGMLSLPRDLWISVPGHGMQKLDQAFADGWSDAQSFEGAVRLSLETIHRDFGIYIDHYAWVGLDGFIKVIDTAGGVDIDPTHPIVDDTYPDDIGSSNAHAYKRLYIAPGPQHLTGPEALEYVRSRHADLVGDFGRSARQQQVLSQLKLKLNSATILSNLPELINDLNGSVKTDMQLPDILSLMNYARSVDLAKVDRVILSPPYSSGFITQDKQDALQPNCTLITPVIARMFALGANATCDTQAIGDSFTSLLPIAQASVFNKSGASVSSAAASVVPQAVGSTTSESDGIHGLLDLLFLTTFESFAGIKV